MDTLTVTLRKPVTIGDLTFDKLELQEPTAGQLEKASSAATSIGMVINLISAVAVVPRKVAESLCQRDFQEASSFLTLFGSASQSIGEMSSPT